MRPKRQSQSEERGEEERGCGRGRLWHLEALAKGEGGRDGGCGGGAETGPSQVRGRHQGGGAR